MWYKRLRRPWRNLESRRHLLHHAKDREGDDSSERAVTREQLFWSSIRTPRGSLLSIKTPCLPMYYIQYSIYSILNQYWINIQYQYQYGLILILNIDKSTAFTYSYGARRAIRQSTPNIQWSTWWNRNPCTSFQWEGGWGYPSRGRFGYVR